MSGIPWHPDYKPTKPDNKLKMAYRAALYEVIGDKEKVSELVQKHLERMEAKL